MTTDTAIAYLRDIGYRVTFATLDQAGYPYWHLWVIDAKYPSGYPVLMSDECIRQRAHIERVKVAVS